MLLAAETSLEAACVPAYTLHFALKSRGRDGDRFPLVEIWLYTSMAHNQNDGASFAVNLRHDLLRHRTTKQRSNTITSTIWNLHLIANEVGILQTALCFSPRPRSMSGRPGELDSTANVCAVAPRRQRHHHCRRYRCRHDRLGYVGCIFCCVGRCCSRHTAKGIPPEIKSRKTTIRLKHNSSCTLICSSSVSPRTSQLQNKRLVGKREEGTWALENITVRGGNRNEQYNRKSSAKTIAYTSPPTSRQFSCYTLYSTPRERKLHTCDNSQRARSSPAPPRATPPNQPTPHPR